MMRIAIPLLTGSVLFSLVCPCVTAEDCEGPKSKLDTGIVKDPDARYPVFIRFTDQMFRRGGDYEKYTRLNNSTKRSTLRKRTLKTLRQKSETAWKTLGKPVAALQKD